MTPIVRSRRPWWRRALWPTLLIGLTVLAGYLATWILVPAPLPGTVIVPSLRGLALPEADEQLAVQGLRLRTGDELPDPHMPEGLIAWQSPAPQTHLPRGSVVMVGASVGTPSTIVPHLGQLDLALAKRLLAAADLRVGRIDSLDAPGEPGLILASMPEGGSVTRTRGSVNLTVSRGVTMVAVPDLTGHLLRDASAALAAVGLRTGTITRRPEIPIGRVLGQDPLPGTMRPRGSRIHLIISGETP